MISVETELIDWEKQKSENARRVMWQTVNANKIYIILYTILYILYCINILYVYNLPLI